MTEGFLTGLLARLRGAGWMVAVHNDYMQGGQAYTFWLLTRADGRWIKGEGRTDSEALVNCVVLADVEEHGKKTKPDDERITHLVHYVVTSRNGRPAIPNPDFVPVSRHTMMRWQRDLERVAGDSRRPAKSLRAKMLKLAKSLLFWATEA